MIRAEAETRIHARSATIPTSVSITKPHLCIMDDSHADKCDTPCSRRPGRGRNGVACAADDTTAIDTDRRLIDRCLSGDISGWEQLYSQQHPRLLKTIQLLLGCSASNIQLIDEMAARVWFALVRRDARLLAQYDPQRHSRLRSFLSGLARIEVLRYLRDERLRKTHEVARGRRHMEEELAAPNELSLMIAEFAATLSPAEREYFEETLIAPPQNVQRTEARRTLSPATIWQRRHRIRAKLYRFFRET